MAVKLPDVLQRRYVAVGPWNVHLLTNREAHDVSPPILFLAGFIVGAHSAIPLAAELARTHNVFAPDLPGYGRTKGRFRTLSHQEQADVIAGLLDALGVPAVAVVANSFSAQLATEFTVRHPKRVVRLVLSGPAVDRHARGALPQLFRLLWNSTREDAMVPGMRGDYVRAGPWRIAGTACNALKYRIEGKLPQVTVPALIVCGERDFITPPRWCRELAGLLPNGRYLELPEFAHGIERVGAPTLAAIVRDFLAEEGEAQCRDAGDRWAVTPRAALAASPPNERLAESIAYWKHQGGGTSHAAASIVQLVATADAVYHRLVEKTVLVVDDDPYIRMLAADVLGEAGYSVALAADGADALRVLDERRVGLVITDYAMPRMDGGELASRVQRLWETPVLLMTSVDLREVASRARTAFKACLEKPFGVQDLLSAVRQTLDAVYGAPEAPPLPA